MHTNKTQALDKEIKNILERYCLNNFSENTQFRFNDLFATGQSLISRKNFFGHITASAIVLDRTLSKILLVHHKNLGKYIQPGGHIDNIDTTFSQAAVRELAEETGFTDILPLSLDINYPDVPIDIDIHTIPENQKKQEPKHLHFDFRYIFILLDTHQGKISEEEIGDIVWRPIRAFENNAPDLARIAQKVRNILSKRKDGIFFDRIKRVFPQLENTNIVMVSHIVPDILPFIQTLHSITKDICVIPKPKSISTKVLSKIPENLIHHLKREQLRNRKTLSRLFPSEKKSLVIDIGGYFATKEFFDFCNSEKSIIGVVEDTENGFIKYKKLDNLLTVPVFSVARSELKQNEDDLVGYSVAYYTEMIMRRKRRLPRYLTVGIIGYGKLGKGVAKYLFNQNIKPFVYDINAIKMVEAYKDGCIVEDKKELLANCHLIFCATGSASITRDDFKTIRPGCYLASVTSSEDEFEIKEIETNLKETKEDDFIVKFENEHTHFYFINRGDAVNFIDKDGDRVGDFIRLVQGEIMAALSLLTQETRNQGLLEVPEDERKIIAQIFLESYSDLGK